MLFLNRTIVGCLIMSVGIVTTTQAASLVTVTTTRDSTTVLHNPMMGFFFHLESAAYNGGDWSGSTDWIYNTAYTQASKYGTTLYIRTTWNGLEPSDGVYTWNTNTDFKNIVATAKSHGFRMAFRVIVQNGGVPAWLVQEIKSAGKDPYSKFQTFGPNTTDSILDLNNSIYQTKFAAFIAAFGKAFDDPTITDYIDVNGLAVWGEGNAWVEGFNSSTTIAQGNTNVPTAQAPYFDWHVSQYNSAFSHVILADNKGWNVPIDDKYNLAYRKDGFGGPDSANWVPWDSITDPSIMVGEPYGGSATIAQEYAHYLSAHCNIVSFRDENLWVKSPTVLAQAVAHLGYRLRPSQVQYAATVTAGSSLAIQHTWVNDAVGVLPNNSPRWNRKYVVAFALFPQSGTTLVQTILDTATNPGNFAIGKATDLTTNAQWTAPIGTYKLAIGILDKTRPADSSLALAMANPTKNVGWYVLGSLSIVQASSSSSSSEPVSSSSAATTSILHSNRSDLNSAPVTIFDLMGHQVGIGDDALHALPRGTWILVRKNSNNSLAEIYRAP